MRLKIVLMDRLKLTLQEDLILFHLNWFHASLSAEEMEKLVIIIEFYGFERSHLSIRRFMLLTQTLMVLKMFLVG